MRRPRPRETIKAAHTIEDVPLICTATEAALLLRCKPETVQRMAREHKIPAAQINRKWLFKRDDLLTYFDSLIEQGDLKGGVLA